MKISSVAQMRGLDRTAIEKFGIEDKLLMENAGFAVCDAIQSEIGVAGRRFAVFCGVGNNGGDGCVVARKLHSNGGDVKVLIVGNPNRFADSARMNFNIIKKASHRDQRDCRCGLREGMSARVRRDYRCNLRDRPCTGHRGFVPLCYRNDK